MVGWLVFSPDRANKAERNVLFVPKEGRTDWERKGVEGNSGEKKKEKMEGKGKLDVLFPPPPQELKKCHAHAVAPARVKETRWKLW